MDNEADGTDDFTAFEAQATGAAEPEKVEAPEAPTDQQKPDDDEQDTNTETNDETDEDGDKQDGEHNERRSKPLRRRLGETTEKWRAAEARAEAAEQRLAALETGKQPETQAQPTELVEPNPDEFEFGEADPSYLKALAKYEVKVELAEERQRNAAATGIAAAQAEAQRLNANWEEMAAKAEEKYPDFKETVIESAAAKEWPLLPLSAAAVASSDNGDDIAYHLATNKADARKLAQLETEFHVARDEALKAGLSSQLVGLFTKPYFDRATEFFEGIAEKAKPNAGKQPNRVTNAPTPPEQRARGSGGHYQASGDTTDFAAFERVANKQ